MATSRAPDPPDHPEHEHTFDDEVHVVVRRSPRYGRFMILGGVAGVLVALLLTGGAGVSGYLSAGLVGFIRVFGVMGIVCVGLGVLVAGLIALLLDRTVGRPRTVDADRETTVRDDLVSPVTDDPPRWLREPLPGDPDRDPRPRRPGASR